MADIWFDVDVALSEVPITLLPLLDDTDFKTREESVVYNQAGLDLVWNFETTAGAFTQTAVTPTDTAGDYDWVNQGNGLYTIEIPASGGATINNDTEGFGWFTGFATGILPWRGPVYGFRKAALNNMLIDGATWTDNLELQYDTTGLTGDTFPATQSQVGNIGSASGGSLSFQVETDNAITDTIDNAAAVDKGSGLVGIPVTGHAFTAGFEITIAGSTNYNNAYTIVSETANEIVITETYVAETFGGSETIVSSIKGVVKVGTEAGTFANTEAQDGSYHVLTNDGDNLDWAYQINVGGGRTGSLINFHGYLTGNNDTVNIQAYDFVGSDWETRAVLQGTTQATDQTLPIKLLSKHTGISGADIGKALIRFVDATAAGHVLGIDELLIEAVGIGQTVGYANGQIWVDTNNGTAGTEAFVNGTADNPVLTWADALTLSSSVGITDFHIINGSTIQLSASSDNFSLFGDNWTLDLNGQSCATSHFQGATVSGTFTGTPEFDDCTIGSITGPSADLHDCGLDGTITANAAGSWVAHHCYSAIAGATTPIFDFGTDAAVNTNVTLGDYRNGIEFRNLNNAGTDLLSLSGTGQVIYAASCSGTVNQRGEWKVTNTGGVTITEDDNTANIAATLTDTTEIGTAGAGLTDLGGMSTGMKNEVGDAVYDEALSGHQTQGTAGAALTMMAYAGPHGPGVYLDDAAANTGTTDGDDGTIENPVSTIAAATTIASSLGLKVIYLVNDSVVTLAQAYEDHRFVGLGVSNKITLGSSDVDNSEFYNVILTGTQGGTGQLRAIGCSLIALASAEIIAESCWWSGDVALRAADNHMFAGCRSSVPGDAAPTLTFPGAGTTKVSVRGHSGGIELVNGIATDTITAEFTAGQLIIAASCNDMIVRPRGVLKVTNNGTNIDIELEAAINQTNINSAVLTQQMTESYAADGVAPTLAQAAFAILQQAGEFAISSTTITVYELDGTTPAMTFTLDDAANPTSRTRAT